MPPVYFKRGLPAGNFHATLASGGSFSLLLECGSSVCAGSLLAPPRPSPSCISLGRSSRGSEQQPASSRLSSSVRFCVSGPRSSPLLSVHSVSPKIGFVCPFLGCCLMFSTAYWLCFAKNEGNGYILLGSIMMILYQGMALQAAEKVSARSGRAAQSLMVITFSLPLCFLTHSGFVWKARRAAIPSRRSSNLE